MALLKSLEAVPLGLAYGGLERMIYKIPFCRRRERKREKKTDRESKTEDIETPRHSKRGPVGQKHHEISFFNVTEVSEGNRAADPIGA